MNSLIQNLHDRIPMFVIIDMELIKKHNPKYVTIIAKVNLMDI